MAPKSPSSSCSPGFFVPALGITRALENFSTKPFLGPENDTFH